MASMASSKTASVISLTLARGQWCCTPCVPICTHFSYASTIRRCDSGVSWFIQFIEHAKYESCYRNMMNFHVSTYVLQLPIAMRGTLKYICMCTSYGVACKIRTNVLSFDFVQMCLLTSVFIAQTCSHEIVPLLPHQSLKHVWSRWTSNDHTRCPEKKHTPSVSSSTPHITCRLWCASLNMNTKAAVNTGWCRIKPPLKTPKILPKNGRRNQKATGELTTLS